MSTFNKYILLLFCLSLPLYSLGQLNRTYTLSGLVADESNNSLCHAVVTVGDSSLQTQPDGRFVFEWIGEGAKQISVRLLGYSTQTVSLFLQRDTALSFRLKSLEESLSTVEVKAVSSNNNEIGQNVGLQQMQLYAYKDLGQQLEAISGVSLLKTGNSISKPMIHGLYGNRLSILNNGVPHSGQQWGNDHSPEIDPLASRVIRVITGAASLEYGGVNPGAVILSEAPFINGDQKVHGQAGYFFESNGLANSLSMRLQQNHPLLAWAVQASLHRSGDLSAPNYYLNNTGRMMANVSVQLQKQFSHHFRSGLYFSTFNTNIGILRGAHIGNLTDLQQAFERELPFYTESNFSYGIESPRQLVQHHLLKWDSKYFFNDRQWLKTIVSGQINWRREYDIRRNSNNTAPAMSILQYNTFAAATYHHQFEFFKAQGLFKTGLQGSYTDNTNQAGTGILPLLPDYSKANLAAFATLSFKTKKLLIDVGLRGDFIFQEVLYISNDLPRRIIRDPRNFNNLSSIAGFSYRFTKAIELKYALSFASRNPAINEMYSYGLHQGISGIEEGNINLNTERGLKNNLQLTVDIAQKIKFSTQIFHQYFENYIYFQAEEKPRLTIRGAFPVYVYQQTDAQIYGADIDLEVHWIKNVDIGLKYSYLRGIQLDNQQPLVYMPPNQLRASLMYRLPSTIYLKKAHLEDLQLGVDMRYVFQQNNLLLEQDFMPSPPAYFLLNFEASMQVILQNSEFTISLRLENMLNQSYRDYLNRQRYFSDEKGINCILGLQYKF